MTLSMSTATRSARMQALVDEMDAGLDTITTTAMMHFYDNPRPAAGAAITTETLIASNTMSQPAGTVATGVLTLDPVTDDVSANADADIGWCRVVDSDDLFIMDMDCGLTGSGAEIIFNSVTARIGGIVKILSGSFTEGNL